MRTTDKEYPQSYYGLMAVLTLGPQTGYDIRKVLDGPEIFYWKESYGNIYPMLRALEHDGLIDKTDTFVKTKKKVIYRINPLGMQLLQKWLEKPAGLNRFRVEILMKLRFGFTAGVPNMMKLLNNYKNEVKSELDEVAEIVDKLKSSEETLDNDLRLISISFLRHIKEFSLLWCDESMEILAKWENQDGVSAVNTDTADHNDMDSSVVSVPSRKLPLME